MERAAPYPCPHSQAQSPESPEDEPQVCIVSERLLERLGIGPGDMVLVEDVTLPQGVRMKVPPPPPVLWNTQSTTNRRWLRRVATIAVLPRPNGNGLGLVGPRVQ